MPGTSFYPLAPRMNLQANPCEHGRAGPWLPGPVSPPPCPLQLGISALNILLVFLVASSLDGSLVLKTTLDSPLLAPPGTQASPWWK